MLTDYERYQLERMIEHGRSLKKFVQGFDLIDHNGIDSLEEAYAIWGNGCGFGGKVFSNEREFKEEDLSAMNVGAHSEMPRQMVADITEMPAKAVELIRSLYVVEGAMAQDYGTDHLFGNIEILTASVRDMPNREAERGQWEGQYKSLIDKCKETRGDEDWDCRDTGALVDDSARDIEREVDAAFEVARIEGELTMHNAAYCNPGTDDLIVSYLHDYMDSMVEVFAVKTYEPSKLVTQLTPHDIEFGEATYELAGQFARHVVTYHSVDELSSADYLDNENLLDVSSTEKLFETGLAIGTAETSDIDLLVKRGIEEGRTVYAHGRGVAIASYLDGAENLRIEVSYYMPHELASLVNVRMAPDASDIRDALINPLRSRVFGHEVAAFDPIDDFLTKMGSPTSISQKWFPMCGDRFEPPMVVLDIKQTDNVREWYMLAFSGDELAVAINPSPAFDDATTAVPTGDGSYTVLGDAVDSLLRECISEELCNRCGYTYNEVYDSWFHESPLPSPAISQQPEKAAATAGHCLNLVDARKASGIGLKGCSTVVTVDGHGYEIMKGATYEDFRKVGNLLDSRGDKSISAFRKQPQRMNLKQAAMEAREASAKLFDKNVGVDSPTRRDER